MFKEKLQELMRIMLKNSTTDFNSQWGEDAYTLTSLKKNYNKNNIFSFVVVVFNLLSILLNFIKIFSISILLYFRI